MEKRADSTRAKPLPPTERPGDTWTLKGAHGGLNSSAQNRAVEHGEVLRVKLSGRLHTRPA